MKKSFDFDKQLSKEMYHYLNGMYEEKVVKSVIKKMRLIVGNKINFRFCLIPFDISAALDISVKDAANLVSARVAKNRHFKKHILTGYGVGYEFLYNAMLRFSGTAFVFASKYGAGTAAQRALNKLYTQIITAIGKPLLKFFKRGNKQVRP